MNSIEAKKRKQRVKSAIEALEYQKNGLQFSSGAYTRAINIKIFARTGTVRCDLIVSPEPGITERFNNEEYTAWSS